MLVKFNQFQLNYYKPQLPYASKGKINQRKKLNKLNGV